MYKRQLHSSGALLLLKKRDVIRESACRPVVAPYRPVSYTHLQMLDTLEAGLQKIQTPDDEVRGMLQIAVPSDLGRNLLLTLSLIHI